MDKTTGRRDHYLPRGYLRGFIDPARQHEQRPLWHFDVLKNFWSTKSVKQVGHRPGFYDYATNEAGLEPADVTFRELENSFPSIRQQIETDFDTWETHLDFLLRFAQMLRARSLLFFEQQKQARQNTPTWTIKEVLNDSTVKLESMTPKPPPESFIRNRSILDMQEQIKNGAAWVSDYNWVLRYTDSVEEPFVISEGPFIATGQQGPDMLVLPISWRACLFGSKDNHGQARTGKIDLDVLRKVRGVYRRGAKLYVISPRKLDDC